MGVRMDRIGFTGMGRVATSASGADRPQTARAARTPRRAAMRSNDDEHLAERRTEAAEAAHLAP